eukprot:16103-Eustigmatos_ZCMA.PRE.1
MLCHALSRTSISALRLALAMVHSMLRAPVVPLIEHEVPTRCPPPAQLLWSCDHQMFALLCAVCRDDGIDIDA